MLYNSVKFTRIHSKDLPSFGNCMISSKTIFFSNFNVVVSIFQIYTDGKGNIINASCTCPRGTLRCSHMAVCLIYASKNISKTDQAMTWKAPAPSTSQTSGDVKDLYPSKDYKALKRAVTHKDKNAFREKLKNIDR